MGDWFDFTAAEWSAIHLSIEVALWCSMITLPLAVAIGWFLARHNFRGKSVVEGILHLPLVLPPVTTGYMLLMILGTRGLIGQYLYEWFGIQLAFSFVATVLAAIVVSFPLATRSVRLAIELIHPKYEEAARTLGAGPVRVFFTITLPLALPGIISGFILSFARSLGEFGATITFAGNIAGETQTLPLAVFSYMQVPGGETSSFRLALVSVIIALVAMIGSEWLNRKIRRH